MKKTKIPNLDLDLYTHKLNNGLEIYIIPKNDINDIYVTYTTKYGANIINFIYNNEKVKVPYGVAHFLEHKMFEQKDGSSPFEQFEKNGANANAFTNYIQTTYLWSGPNYFDENMKILLNYVNNPYFTDKNVEKEKGIIIQELKMYEDSPFRKGMQRIKENILVNHPSRIDIGGTIQSVNSITKEDLYKCYNAFYQPNNMFIVVTGNVNPKHVIDVIKSNYKNNNKCDVIKKNYIEPLEVNKNKETIYMNVTIPKFFLGFKFNMDNYKISNKEWIRYLTIYFDSLIGATSDFNQQLKDKKIITDDLDFYIDQVDNYLIITVLAESKKPAMLEKLIKNELHNSINKKVFERKKKCYISSSIKLTDSIYGINRLITGEIIKYNSFDKNLYEELKNLNYNNFDKFIKQLDFNNSSVLFIKPIKEN